RLHSNVAGLIVEVNLKVGVRSVVLRFGPFVIVVSGQGFSGGVSELASGLGATLPQSAGVLVSSPASRRVAHPAAIERLMALPSGMPPGSTFPPVAEGRGVPLVLLKLPQE